ncbi:TlpA disulfide reductase family protein [Spirosoma profusum]|nr:TlpA disulfide reductase family protein [Spirosoma profusum]
MKAGIALFITLLLGNVAGRAQSVPVLKFDDLEQRIKRPNDTLYVVNFWATWCAPCVKELPLFESARKTYASQKVSVLLVSMDARKTLTSKVIPFVRNRKIGSNVVLLDEPDLNTWIDKLAPEWSGALPMTLVLNEKRNVRQFIGKPVKDGELESIINKLKH